MGDVMMGRYTAAIEGEFVVFLIGARINKPWALHRWLPVAFAMPRMIRELERQPELGFLGVETYGGRTTLMVQYWRSLEQLLAYAHAKNAEHLPAWRAFNQKAKSSGAIGIWHETYVIKPGCRETFYGNMPHFGLGRVAEKHGTYVEIGAKRESAKERLTTEATP